MREADMISEHINYLLHYEIIFCGLLASAIVTTAIFSFFVSFHVNGDSSAKLVFCLIVASTMGIYLFLVSAIAIFYVTIQIKFSLLNDYFR